MKDTPYIMRKGVSLISDLKDGGSVYGYPGEYPGRDYFVNNITGSSGASGLTWGDAMDQVSTAISASETYRELQGTATNDYVRNRIFVQGTGTPYTKLAALPNYCDIIGVGADPRGNGPGIARIESDTGEDSIAASVRGLNMYNMQIGGSTTGTNAGYAMNLAVIYRSRFENCTFANKRTAAVHIVKGGGVVFKDCSIGPSDTLSSVIGLLISGTGGDSNFNNCVIEDCIIWGEGTGVKLDTYTNNFTVFKNNYIMGATIGVDDNCASTDRHHHAVYLGNYVYSDSNCFEFDQNEGETCFGNWANEGGVTAWEDAITYSG